MTKNTSRDRIWSAAIDIRDDLADPGSTPIGVEGTTFRVPDVADWLERQGEDVPSERTLTDTLESMADAGVLDRESSGGHGQWARYAPPAAMQPPDPDGCQVCEEPFGLTGADRMDLTMWKRNENPDQTLHLCRECLAAYPDLSERRAD